MAAVGKAEESATPTLCDSQLPDLGKQRKFWSQSPLFLCEQSCHSHYSHSVQVSRQITGGVDSTSSSSMKKEDPSSSMIRTSALLFNKEFCFETKSFRGKAILRIAGLSGRVKTPRASDGGFFGSSGDSGTANVLCDESSYFSGKKRKMSVTIQGEFKRSIPIERVVSGQCFGRPLRQIPARMLVSSGLAAVSALSPTLLADIDDECPYFVGCMASAAQAINISELPRKSDGVCSMSPSKEDPTLIRSSSTSLTLDHSEGEEDGEQPTTTKADVDEEEAEESEHLDEQGFVSVFDLPLEGQYTDEDITLLDPSVFSKRMSIAKRKAFFSKYFADKNRKASDSSVSVGASPDYAYSPTLNGKRVVWRMEFYSHLMDPLTYDFLLLGLRTDLSQYISSPIQINGIVMGKDFDDDPDDFTDIAEHSTQSPFEKRLPHLMSGESEKIQAATAARAAERKKRIKKGAHSRESGDSSETSETTRTPFGSMIDMDRPIPRPSSAYAGGGEDTPTIREEARESSVEDSIDRVMASVLDDESGDLIKPSRPPRTFGRKLFESECLWNFSIWHESLVKTLHPEIYSQWNIPEPCKKSKKSSSFLSRFW